MEAVHVMQQDDDDGGDPFSRILEMQKTHPVCYADVLRALLLR